MIICDGLVPLPLYIQLFNRCLNLYKRNAQWRWYYLHHPPYAPIYYPPGLSVQNIRLL